MNTFIINALHGSVSLRDCNFCGKLLYRVIIDLMEVRRRKKTGDAGKRQFNMVDCRVYTSKAGEILQNEKLIRKIRIVGI